MTLFLTLSILILAAISFIFEWLPVDLTALVVAIGLILCGIVTPDEGISGFSNSATITVMAMFILSAGIVRTDATQSLRNLLLKWGGTHYVQQLLVMGLIVGPLSAFINNTAIVAIFLPIVEDWCKHHDISVSKLLLPLSYFTILGGTITVIGTSTNLLASELAQQLGYEEFSLFQFTQLGLVTFSAGLVYLIIAAPRLLSERKKPNSDLLDEDYKLKDYLSEAIVTPGSSLIGQTLRQSGIQRKFDLDVLELIHDNHHFPPPLADKVLSAKDILLVRGSQADLLKLREEKTLGILPDFQFKEEALESEIVTGEEKIAEVLILSNSRLIGMTLKDLRFRQRYNVTVLAIRRGQELLRERLGKIPLRFGDLLLVQGPKDSFLGLQTTRELLVLEQRDLETLPKDKAPIAIAIVIGVVVVAAFNWIPILVSALVGVILMVLTGCLKAGEIYGAVRWDVIFLLAGLIPLGIAMDKSGATQWLAENLLALGGNLSGYWLLLFFFVATALLTEILSNNASVVLMMPVAVKVAQSLSLNPYAFMFAVTFAASNSFMSPIGYQTNTMVYAPGGYKFLDFFRIGAPLSLLMATITPLLIIWFYGL